jgi:hypothetical protein
MRPARARKSSTSSGRRERARTRYLGLEVASEPLLPFLPSRWTVWLAGALERTGTAPPPFRLVRCEGARAIVRAAVADAAALRSAWDGFAVPGGSLRLRTVRTWGTMVGAKAWLLREPVLRRPTPTGSA